MPLNVDRKIVILLTLSLAPRHCFNILLDGALNIACLWAGKYTVRFKTKGLIFIDPHNV